MENLTLTQIIKPVMKRKLMSVLILILGLGITAYICLPVMTSNTVDVTISIVENPLRESAKIRSTSNLIFNPGSINMSSFSEEELMTHIQLQRSQQREILKATRSFSSYINFQYSVTLLSGGAFKQILVEKGYINHVSEFSLVQSKDTLIMTVHSRENFDKIIEEAELYIEGETKKEINKNRDFTNGFLTSQEEVNNTLFNEISNELKNRSSMSFEKKYELMNKIDNYATNLALNDIYTDDFDRLSQVALSDLKPTITLLSTPSSQNKLMALAVAAIGFCFSLILICIVANVAEYFVKFKNKDSERLIQEEAKE